MNLLIKGLRLLICFRSSMISMSPFTKSKPTKWQFHMLHTSPGNIASAMGSYTLRTHFCCNIFTCHPSPNLQFFFFVFFVCLFFSHPSWGRSWLPYILHYLAREGAVLEKDRTWYTWSLPQKGEKPRNWTEVFRGPALGALVASLWERHSNIGAKVPFQRFLCRDCAFFEHALHPKPVKPVLPRKLHLSSLSSFRKCGEVTLMEFPCFPESIAST